jgi:hypothetical protein
LLGNRRICLKKAEKHRKKQNEAILPGDSHEHSLATHNALLRLSRSMENI